MFIGRPCQMDNGWIMNIGLPAAIFDQIYTTSAFQRRISWNVYRESLISLYYEVTVVVQVISCMLARWSPRNYMYMYMQKYAQIDLDGQEEGQLGPSQAWAFYDFTMFFLFLFFLQYHTERGSSLKANPNLNAISAWDNQLNQLQCIAFMFSWFT